jgi:hypothetical protein
VWVCVFVCECVLHVSRARTFRAHVRIIHSEGENVCTRARKEAAPSGPGRPRREQCALSKVQDHAVMKYYPPGCARFVRCSCIVFPHFISLFYVQCICEGDVPIAAKRSAERVRTC